MKLLLHILKFRILTFFKFQGKVTARSLMIYFSASAVYLLFAVGIYFFTHAIIKYLLEDVRIGMYLVHRFIFVVLFLFFVVVNIGNIIVSYSTFYKTGDTGFLLTKPVPFDNIFLVKFLDNFFYSSSTLLLIVTASLAGYTSYFGLSWYFIPFGILFLIMPFMFISGTLGVIILLIVLRFAGTFGIRKVLIIIASAYAGAIILFYMFSSPVELVTKVFENFPNLDDYMGYLENPAVTLLPNHWVANALYWIASDRFWNAGWYIVLLAAASILSFMFSLLLAKKWFYKTWLTFLNISNEFSAGKNKRSLPFSFEKDSRVNPGREVLLKRELFLFIREPNQWIHLTVMLFLIILFMGSVSSIDVMVLNPYNIYLKTLIYIIIYLFNVFLIASLSLRFVFPLVSLEGETVWKIRSAPVSYKNLILTRLLIYFSVIFLIGQLLNFVSNYQFSILLLAVSQLNTAFVTITLVSLNFGMGALFANYREKNPIRVASSQWASLTFLFTIIYLVFLIILLFAPINNYFDAVDNGRFIPIYQFLFTSLILGITAFVLSYFSISKGAGSLKRDI